MKQVKILTIVLVLVLVTMIAFFGVYIPTQNRMSNKVKEYSYAMDLKGARTIRLKVDDTKQTIIKDAEGKEVEQTEELTDEQIAEKGYTKEEKTENSAEVLTQENYQASKKIIEKRLEKLGVNNYVVKLDEQTGEILVELPENEATDNIISNIGTTGKFEIVDKQTDEVLMDDHDIKLANVVYGSGSNSGTTASGTMVYLNIEFTKEGSQKLENISNQYREEETENTENAENTEAAEETNQKEISMKIDEEEIMSTSFDETLKTGKLQLSIGRSTTNQKTLQGYIGQATSMAVVLDTGKMPIKYNVEENQYILSDITTKELNVVFYSMAAVVGILLFVWIVRYKIEGLLAAISYIGFVSIFLLLIRYANVVVSIEGIFGMAMIFILNYLYGNLLLKKCKKEKMEKSAIIKVTKETYTEFFIKIIPICIAVITFCFMSWEPISSLGTIMFWGIAWMAIHNIIVTNYLFKIKASK